jgi:excisionase family DNA binding protein
MTEPEGLGNAGRQCHFLTAADLMRELQLSENTVYRELQYGSLKDVAFRVGRQWRISEAALNRLMRGGID